MSGDVVARAKAALEHPCPCGTPGCKKPNPRELARLFPDLVAEVEKLRLLLQPLIDPDDCWFDHEGGCQAHGYFGGFLCPHEAAKRALGELA